MAPGRSFIRRVDRRARARGLRRRIACGVPICSSSMVRRRGGRSSRADRSAGRRMPPLDVLPHRTGKRTDMTHERSRPRPDALARLRAIRIVPVIMIDDPDDAVPLAARARRGRPCVRRDHLSHAARGGSAAAHRRRSAGDVRRRGNGADARAGESARATPARSSLSRRGSIRASSTTVSSTASPCIRASRRRRRSKPRSRRG